MDESGGSGSQRWADRSGRARRQSGLRDQALAALGAASGEDLPALLRRHTRTKTVRTLAVDGARLEGALHGGIVRINQQNVPIERPEPHNLSPGGGLVNRRPSLPRRELRTRKGVRGVARGDALLLRLSRRVWAL